jgi:REP element-mobilizing transposase RayT
MARTVRLEGEGAVYHVIVRGNERKAVFRDDRDRRAYLERLAKYRERFGFRLLAFCLMGNHIHLAIERGPTKLSRVMLTLQSAYAQGFNRRHGRVGHLFQGRYKAFLIEKDRYLMALIRYIHENPVKAGLAARAHEYEWSSDRYYRRGKGPEWLDLDVVLPVFGRGRKIAVARYRQFMGEEEAESYEDLKSYAQAIKGDEAFAERTLRAAGRNPIARMGLTEREVASVVGKACGFSGEELGGSGRHRPRSRARILAAYLARAEGGISVARMARFFGREESTLVRGVLRLEQELRTSEELRQEVARFRKAVRSL